MDLKKLKIDWKLIMVTGGIVIVSALVVGGVTWYVMDKSAKEVQQANEKTATELQKQINSLKGTSSMATKKTGDTLVSVDNTYNLYTNYDLGFEIKVPKQAYYADASCSYVTANGDHSYRPVGGLVPTKVIVDNGVVSLTQEYFYHLTGETKSTDGRSFYSGCSKVLVSAAVLKDTNYWEPSKWNINVKAAKTDTELTSLIQSAFGAGCGLGAKSVTANAGTVAVAIQGDGLGLDNTKCPVNYMTALFYNQSKGAFAYWAMGQASAFYKTDYTGGYDTEMKDSFKFL